MFCLYLKTPVCKEMAFIGSYSVFYFYFKTTMYKDRLL